MSFIENLESRLHAEMFTAILFVDFLFQVIKYKPKYYNTHSQKKPRPVFCAGVGLGLLY
jgi:hypothetical protein